MNQKITTLMLTLLLMAGIVYSQTTFKDYTVGHPFHVSLPEYMAKTVGLNSAASFQFKNTVKDIAGFIIEDNKEELQLAEMSYSSINEFYEEFIKDFLADEDKRKISKPQNSKRGEINFTESDATYYDKEAKVEIYYFIGIVETKSSYYKFLCYGAAESKDKYKPEFQKILYSIKD